MALSLTDPIPFEIRSILPVQPHGDGTPRQEEGYNMVSSDRLNVKPRAFALIFFLLLLIPVSGMVYAGEMESPPAASIYTSVQTSPGILDNLTAFFRNLILPNIMGAVALFIMSSLFSGINFYTTIQMKQHTFRVMARYLISWIFF